MEIHGSLPQVVNYEWAISDKIIMYNMNPYGSWVLCCDYTMGCLWAIFLPL